MNKFFFKVYKRMKEKEQMDDAFKSDKKENFEPYEDIDDSGCESPLSDQVFVGNKRILEKVEETNRNIQVIQRKVSSLEEVISKSSSSLESPRLSATQSPRLMNHEISTLKDRIATLELWQANMINDVNVKYILPLNKLMDEYSCQKIMIDELKEEVLQLREEKKSKKNKKK